MALDVVVERKDNDSGKWVAICIYRDGTANPDTIKNILRNKSYRVFQNGKRITTVNTLKGCGECGGI